MRRGSRRPVRSIAAGAGHALRSSCRLWRAPAGCARASTVGRARRGARGVKANRDAQRESIAPAVGAPHAHAHVFAHPARPRRRHDSVPYAAGRTAWRPARRSPRSDCCCSGCCCARCHALAAHAAAPAIRSRPHSPPAPPPLRFVDDAAAQHTAGLKASAMESFAFAPAKKLLWVALALASSAGPRLAAANNLPSDDAAAACDAWANLQPVPSRQPKYRAGCNNYISQGGTLTACKAYCDTLVRSAPPRVGC